MILEKMRTLGGSHAPTVVYTFIIFLTSTAIAGETALDRLANALGGKAILPHIIRTIPQMLVSRELFG